MWKSPPRRNNPPNSLRMLQIPPDRLAPDTLAALIEEFVTRHGTDLSESADSAARVRRMLLTGEVAIVFDQDTQTANIVARDHKPQPAPINDPRQVIYDHAPPPPDWPD